MQRILLATLASLGLLAIAGCNEKDSKDQEDKLFNKTSSYKGGKVIERVADKTIGDMTKDIEFPLAISDNFEIIEVMPNVALYGDGSGSGYVNWTAKFKNKTDKEVASVINVCDSANATMKVVPSNQYYLVDCEQVRLRFGPNGQSTSSVQFASTQPWTSAKGSTARLCIKDVGCIDRLLITEDAAD